MIWPKVRARPGLPLQCRSSCGHCASLTWFTGCGSHTVVRASSSHTAAAAVLQVSSRAGPWPLTGKDGLHHLVDHRDGHDVLQDGCVLKLLDLWAAGSRQQVTWRRHRPHGGGTGHMAGCVSSCVAADVHDRATPESTVMQAHARIIMQRAAGCQLYTCAARLMARSLAHHVGNPVQPPPTAWLIMLATQCSRPQQPGSSCWQPSAAAPHR
jgi:hypothetical protein